MRESDIKHQNGDFWVGLKNGAFIVFKPHGCGSISDSAYANPSLAIARCDYLARHAAKGRA